MTDTVLVALDLGGSAMKGAVVDVAGKPVTSIRRDTPKEDGPSAVIERLLEVIEELIELGADSGYSATAVGVAVPGVVDEHNGVAVFSANLGWRDVRLRELIGARIGLPVTVSHDVRAGGLAEATVGSGRGVSDFLFLPIGTGIAGAVVTDGRVYSGAHGGAGELGHVVVEPDGPSCGCGGRGCLERLASASALEVRYGERTGISASAEDIVKWAAGGDGIAGELLDGAVRGLSTVLTTYCRINDPELIVVGGGLAIADEVLLAPLRGQLSEQLSFQQPPRIVPAALGDQAGCIGAALAVPRRFSPS